MSSRWTGFFIWALVAASTAFWGIKIFAATRPVPSGAQAPRVVAANGPMERLFGAVEVPTVAPPPQHPESERYQLVGVIAPPGATIGGFALISLDGQPARTWRVGAAIDGNTSLLSVSKRGAEFGPAGGPTAFTLQLPEPATAETGTLAPATSQPDPSQMQNVQPQVSTQFENSQHVAQPQPPGMVGGRGGFPGRMGVPQRPLYPNRPAADPTANPNLQVPRMAAPPDQTQNNENSVQTQQQ